jgi:uncharacterized surface protein with fasciclin (FAS1) repeats
MMNNRLPAAVAIALCLASSAVAQTAPVPAPAPAPPATVPPPAVPPQAAAPMVFSLQLAPGGDIIDTLKASGQFTLLLKALDAANLTDFLRGAGPYTLLAPTDAAFQALPPAQLAALMQPANAPQLQALLSYHLISAGVPLMRVQGASRSITSLDGPDVRFDGEAASIRVNDANVEGQAMVTNGDVYAIDKVLTPPLASPSTPATLATPDCASPIISTSGQPRC